VVAVTTIMASNIVILETKLHYGNIVISTMVVSIVVTVITALSSYSKERTIRACMPIIFHRKIGVD
jgi:hypothetical protein